MNNLSTLGFHEMSKHFQLKYVQEQCEQVVENLDAMIKDTEKAAAPVRKKKFMFVRTDAGKPSGKRKEAVWERAIWSEYGPSSCYPGHEFLPGVCRFIRSFQVPLKAKRSDPWGKIDLLGVAPDLRPVVIELKSPGASDTPLRFLIEAVTYGVILRKIWHAPGSHFRNEWAKALKKSLDEVPQQLETLTLICAAPEEYWTRCTGPQGGRGVVTPAGWRSIRKLVGKFWSRGFCIEFAQVTSSAPNVAPRGISVEAFTPFVRRKRYATEAARIAPPS